MLRQTRSRSWELALLLALLPAGAVASAPELALQTGHVGEVAEAAWSPDGNFVASRGSGDGSVRVWDPRTGALLATVRPGPLAGMRWAPDGRRIAAWEQAGAIHVWNAATGQIDAKVTSDQPIREAAWSPDGSRFTLAREGSCIVADSSAWSAAATLADVTAPLRYSHDGTRLFAGGVIWRASGDEALALLQRFEPSATRADPTEWSPDDRLIASAGPAGLRVWNASDGTLLQEIATPKSVRALAWSPDGSMLAAGAIAVSVYRKTASGSPLLELAATPGVGTAWIGGLGWSRGGDFLAAADADGWLTIWNAGGFAQAARARAHSKNIHSLQWSPSADLVVTSSADALVRVWNASAEPVATMASHTRPQKAVRWSPDSRFIAVGADDGPVRVWEIESGQIVAALQGEKTVDPFLAEWWKVPATAQIFNKPVATHAVRALDWPAAGTLAVLATNGGSGIELWDPLRSKLLSRIDLRSRDAFTFASSPDGLHFAVGMRAQGKEGRATRIFDSSGRELAAFDPPLAGGDRAVRSISWSKDGILLARSGSGLEFLVADLKASHGLGEPVGGCCVAFSPDGTLLVGGGAVWDVTTRQKAGVVPAAEASAVAWSPDSRHLAIADGRDVVIQDMRAGRPEARLTGHELDVADVTWSPDSLHLVTASADGTLRLWSAGGEMLATMAVLDEGRDWLVTTPDGLFDGSPGAWKLVGWHADPDHYLRISPAEIFFREFFYPGLLTDLLRGKKPRATASIASLDRRQPAVRFAARAPQAGLESRAAELKIEVEEAPPDAGHPRGGGARDVRLFRNGSLVALWEGDVLAGKKKVTLTATVPIVAGENHFTAWAFNASNIKSEDASLTLLGGSGLARRGRMRIVAVGIDAYANPAFDLRYARSDAAAFAEELTRQQKTLGTYGSVDVTALADSKATREGILSALRDAAASVAPEDALIVFFAGHGLAAGSRFHLLPHDFGYSGARADLDEAALARIASTSISDLDLERVLRGAASERILLVIDACNSGQALESEERRRGPMNSKGLAQLAWEKGMNVVTAAQGYQAALETARLGHGLLTWALVEEGMKGGAADLSPRDGELLVREWLDFAARRVPQLQEDAMADAQAGGREVAFVDGEETVRELARRSLQRPRVFYRREPEREPFVIARAPAPPPQ